MELETLSPKHEPERERERDKPSHRKHKHKDPESPKEPAAKNHPPPAKMNIAQFNSKTLNVAVLGASMNEHQQQIHRNLTPAVVKFFHAVYSEAKKQVDQQLREQHKEQDTEKPRVSDLRILQEKLKGIPRWSQRTVDKVTALVESWVINKRFNLAKVLKTLVVGKTMLLVSVAKNDDGSADRVRVEVPNVDSYVHNVLCLAAENLYAFPSLVKIERGDTESSLDIKNHKLRQIIRQAIDNAILDLLPSDSVNEYLDGAMDAQEFESAAKNANEAAMDDLSAYGFEKEDKGPAAQAAVLAPEAKQQQQRPTSPDAKKAVTLPGEHKDEHERHGRHHKHRHRHGNRHKRHYSDSDTGSESGSGSGSGSETGSESDDEPTIGDSEVRSAGQLKKVM